MPSGRTSRSVAGASWAVLGALFLAGCVAMPDSGDPQQVPSPQGAGADNGVQVRVIPVPPRDGQSQRDVVQNFLDASIADEADYQTAKAYLTEDAQKSWRPESGVTVVADTNPGQPVPATDPQHADIQLSSTEIGQLDAKHSYTALQDPNFSTTFSLVNEAKDGKDGTAKPRWRIAVPPPGLIVSRANFRSTFQQLDRYFFTAEDPSTSVVAAPVLVPDPIYLRRRIDPATAAAKALVQDGPSDWLSPVVRSAFADARIVGTVGDNPRNPKVTVDGVDLSNSQQCQKMVAQLYFTLASQSGSVPIDSVQLSSARHGACQTGFAQMKSSAYAPGSLAGTGQAYFRAADTGQLRRMVGPDTSPPVAGVLGAAVPAAPLAAGGHSPAPFAVARDSRSAAVVSQDGRSLYVAGLADGSKLGDPVATSRGSSPDQALTSPSWDGFGGLWVVDRDPAGPRVLLIRGQSPVTVSVEGLGSRTVDGIRLSSDGTRAALLLKDGAGVHSLMLGRVLRSGTPAAPVVQIGQLRSVAPQLSGVTSVSWADTDLLLALGKESDSVPQLYYVGMDGLQTADSALQAVDGMTVVAASENRTDYVFADSNDSARTVYSLSAGAQWQWRAYAKDGVQPAYPG